MSEAQITTMEQNTNDAKRKLLIEMMNEVDGCFDNQEWEIKNFIESFFREI